MDGVWLYYVSVLHDTMSVRIMFAVKRTASVPARIRLLIVSMITINGINIVGVP